MLLNLTASVLEKEAEYGIEILHPAWETTVMANDPVSFQLTPSLDIAELSVFENGVEVYRGTDVPDELRLSAPIEEEGEWHRLTVRVTDSDGDVRQRYTRYQVRRLALDIPELSHGRVHGE